jgi:hypothetical protein
MIISRRLWTDTAMFYIFNAEVIENTLLHSIRDNYMILERIDFTYMDLVKWDWEITYPEESEKQNRHTSSGYRICYVAYKNKMT